MRALAGKRVLVHCRVNMRASVITNLFRVIHLQEGPASTYDTVSRVWTPSGFRKKLIQERLRKHAIAFDPF